MADFVGLLKKTIDGQAQPTPQLRARVYDRARATVAKKLVDVDVPKKVADQQLEALEAAIKEVEAEYANVEKALLEPILTVEPEETKEAVNIVKGEAPAKETMNTAPVETPAIEPALPVSASKIVPDAEPLIFAKPVDITSSGVQKDSPMVVGAGATSVPAAEPVFVTGQKVQDASGIMPIGAAASHIVAQPLDNIVPSVVATNVPDAEPVNMDGVLAAQAHKQSVDQAGVNATAGQAKGQTGDFDLVSDIFTQAAKRGERKEKKRKFLIIGSSVAALLLLVTAILFIAWDFLGSRLNTKTDGNVPVATDSSKDVETPKEKLTQRLLPDGSETDPGPAQGTNVGVEGTTTATSTPAALPDVPGEAVLYESRTENDMESVETGEVKWTLLHEAGHNDGPEELAIRGNITIPKKNISLIMTIRRNHDESIPAAYIIELVYSLPEDFSGGTIQAVKELTFKASEQSYGQKLNGLSYFKINDNFFYFTVSSMRPFIDGDLNVMRQLSWIRLVNEYQNKRIGELTFSKGPSGEAIFNEVIDSWSKEQSRPTLFDEQSNRQNGTDASQQP